MLSGRFGFILAMVLMAHISLLTMRMLQSPPDEVASEKALKVRILQELRRDKQQIVQSEDSDQQKKPKDPAFQSDKDRSFERQTKARKVAPWEKSARGNSSQDSDKSKTAHKKQLKDLKLSDIGAAGNPDPFQQAQEEAPAKSKKGTASGDPTEGGIGSTNDYIEDVPLGDITALNTVENKYYGFFHRIRQKLEQFWGRSIQEKAEAMIAEGRTLQADENLITSLQVTLDQDGEIVKVKIMGTSGVKELDDAAIESFNEAGPFPNPPKDLLVDGQATIEWGFVVQI